MPIVKTSAKGQVVIPSAIREKIGLKPGDKVLVALSAGNKVTVEPLPADPMKAAHGMLRNGPSLTAALLQERKRDHAREEDKASRLLRSPRLSRKGKRLRES